ncbi:MAG TPA: ABC transporter permease [Bryobacteraceae bacterium]|jgi:ABC-2 type transport system permease protein|nr:ABC transporter permease [Bryobacteraceae bacterium]
MRERLTEIIRKEFRQAFRDTRMRTLLFLPPLIQLMIFGLAVNLDVDHSNIAWMDGDRSFQSRELLAAFQGTGRFEVVATPANDREAQALLDANKVDMVVRVLPGFERDIQRSRPTSVQLLINGSNSNTANIVSGYASSIVTGFAGTVMQEQSRDRVTARMAQTAIHVSVPDLKSQSRVWFNPELKSRNYFVPGIVVNILMQITLMMTAMAIVREKEIGTMEQLMVSPIRPVELMLGKTLPFALVGLVDMVLVVTASLLLFHVPFRGSPLLLFGCSILFLMTSLGAGLFISTISQTQQQAMMTTFLLFQPFFLLSGFTFPLRNMPESIQYLTLLNPVRYFIEIVRGLFLKGSGVSVLWPQMVALAIFGVVILSLSAMRFRKRLD